MRTAWLFQLLFVSTLLIKSQPSTIDLLSFGPTDTLPGAYRPSAQKHIFIASKFGRPEVDAHKALDSISGFMIREIVLVYSRYRKSDNFSQSKLNRARWSNLLQRYPSLFQSGTTTYRDVCQAGVKNDSVARELTHGFYIYYENAADPEVRSEEIAAIARYLDDMGVDTAAGDPPEKPEDRIVPAGRPEGTGPRLRKPMKTRDPKMCRQPFYGRGMEDLDDFFVRTIDLSKKQKRSPEKVRAEVHLKLDHNGQIRSAYVLSVDKEFIGQIRAALARMNLWHPAVLNGITIKTSVKIVLQSNPNGFVHVQGPLGLPRALAKCGLQPDEEIFGDSEIAPGERKLPSVFDVSDHKIMKNIVERNKTLDSILLVVDLTGSMGPYIAQVLDLMAEMVEKNNNRVLSIALFNDGNNKPDKAKKIGSTGGIIILQGDITMDVLGEAVLRSMKKGNGGDVMENNIEAVLQGLNACKGCNNVMLVCDNFATPRDGSLLSGVDRPIHWIICGASGGINVNYLDLARTNRGVIHTGSSDVPGLHEVQENQTIQIDGFSYKLVNGKFRMLKTE